MSATTFITLKDAVVWLGPRRLGSQANPETVRRWCNKGLCGVRLQSVSRGGMRLTSEQWLEDFFRDLEAVRRPAAPAPFVSPTAARRDSEAALERLRKKGVLK